MSGEIKRDITELPVKDIELKLRINGAPGRCVVIELVDGVCTMHNEISTVKDVPFKKKGRKK